MFEVVPTAPFNSFDAPPLTRCCSFATNHDSKGYYPHLSLYDGRGDQDGSIQSHNTTHPLQEEVLRLNSSVLRYSIALQSGDGQNEAENSTSKSAMNKVAGKLCYIATDYLSNA